jgi:hypothetical protein
LVTERVFRIAFLVAGGCLLVGGPLHPRPDTLLSFDESTARMLANPGWGPSHALQLVAFAAMVVGAMALVGTPSTPLRVRQVARAVAAASVVATLEMTFHLAAMTEADALRAGASTPLVTTHMRLALVAYPAFGLTVAALAIAGRRTLARIWLVPVGVVGGLTHAIAGPLVVLTRDQRYSPLFIGGAALALWIVGAGMFGLRRPAEA